MAVNTTPIYVLTPNVQQSQAAPIAVTAFVDDNATNKTLAWSAGVNGSILEKVVVSIPVTGSVADQISFWWFDGVHYYWWKSVKLGAGGTLSATVQPQSSENPALNTPEVYPTGWKLYWSSFAGGQTTTVVAYGGDY